MLIYRATLTQKAATRTPWQADTLFGHLCWQIVQTEGAATLAEFLEPYRQGQPPLLLSNGFPGDYLPRPLLPASPPVAKEKQAQVAAMKTAKKLKNIRWVSLAAFNQLRQGQQPDLELHPAYDVTRIELKNQINRLTFGTDSERGGNLYNVDELAFVDKDQQPRQGLDVSIYVKVKDEAWAERAEQLFNHLAHSGYGARKTVGYGHFQLKAWQRFTGFDDPPPQANGFVSLSNWVPAPTDPTEGFYRRLVKYGKLGESLATIERPFKHPLIMLTAGSSFYASEPEAWYGRLVDGLLPEGVLPDEMKVVHYGYAFVLPARLVETAAKE